MFSIKKRRKIWKRYLNYKRSAKKRGKEFNIGIYEFCNLVTDKCYYCGKMIDHNNLNGIDRADSTLGYVYNNVLPCCFMCNKMKSNHSVSEFIERCNMIAQRHKNSLDGQINIEYISNGNNLKYGKIGSTKDLKRLLLEDMRDSSGRFMTGRPNPYKKSFIKGQNGYRPQAYWKKEWLIEEYIKKNRSVLNIAEEFDVKRDTIKYWLRKYKIYKNGK